MVHCWSVRLVGVAALLYVLCLTPLLVGLLWHVLLDVVALGPGHGIADLLGDVLTILLVLVLSDGSVALLALLLGDCRPRKSPPLGRGTKIFQPAPWCHFVEDMLDPARGLGRSYS